MGKSRNISQVLNDQGLIEAADLAPGVGTPEQGFNFRNRIINGDMRIDQRNAGASSSPVGDGYFIDRYRTSFTGGSKFTVGQNLNSVTPPSGFVKYAGLQVLTAGSIAASDINTFVQYIEGTNISDLAWGTSEAKSVTLSFWIRSNITGTFGGALQNSAANRSYPFTYTISAANTWEYKTITIAGDTTGTWLTTTGVGIRVIWSQGTGSTYSGTAGAWAAANYYSATGATSIMGSTSNVWYITGVQLEVGSVATPFERRPYGTELALCQRYYQELGAISYTYYGGSGSLYESGIQSLLVSMRTPPSFSTSSISYYSGVVTSMTPTIYNGIVYATTSVSSAGYGGFYGTVKASAEL